MSQLRNLNLLYADAWQKAYEAITSVDFVASDYESYRSALIQYLIVQYPEFTDFTENQLLMIITDLISYLGENINYKIDLNARDNFIETTSNKDSLLNLAKLIGYYPKRNYPANGLVKITKISTTEDVRDSLNNSLQNSEIIWNDPSNPDWLEQFMLVLNSALIYSNPFGKPVKGDMINNVTTTLYEFNSQPLVHVSYPYSCTVNGQTMSFEIVNPDLDDGEIVERYPNIEDTFHILYRNDGSGNNSVNTGFFFYFKQGTLSYSDYKFDDVVENRTIDINAEGINQKDIFVTEINDNGYLKNKWTEVKSIYNIIYNDEDPAEVRNIFKVLSKDNDTVTIQFADGRFGNIPYGMYRIWYRVSNGLSYTIKSSEMKNVTISIPYYKNTGNTDEIYKLSITFSLMVPVNNSIPAETFNDIQTRAPDVYAAQNRMISGEDYNNYPLTYGNLIKKLKAINRTFSGHTRYVDLNDPTGSYQSTNVFSDDGMIYREYYNEEDTQVISEDISITTNDIIKNKIKPLLDKASMDNFYYAYFDPKEWKYANSDITFLGTSNISTAVGSFYNDVGSIMPLGDLASDNGRYVTDGSMIKLITTHDETSEDYEELWVNVISVSNDEVTLSEPLDFDKPWIVSKIYQAFNKSFTNELYEEITDKINSQSQFGIRYNIEHAEWQIIDDVNVNPSEVFDYNTLGSNADSSWLIYVKFVAANGEYSPYWYIKSRNLKYTFESKNDVRFFLINDDKIIDINTNKQMKDFITVLKNNKRPDTELYTMQKDYKWDLVSADVYNDGYIEPRRVNITMSDSDLDGFPDDPVMFNELVAPFAEQTPEHNNFLFWKRSLDESNYEYFAPTTDINVILQTYISGDEATLRKTYKNLYIKYGTVIYYVIDSDEFYYDDEEIFEKYENNEYYMRIGRNGLNFQWRHFASVDNKIDPSPSNIVDMYVLTTEYFNKVNDWIKSTNRSDFPETPTSEELRITFKDLNEFKSISDSIVWHSTKFKLLFGDYANSKLKADFKVVKLPEISVTDNEIKKQIISLVDQFFDISTWDFGGVFSFTELATYVQSNMASYISSFVIVPQDSSYKFGQLFEIRMEENELPVSTATVENIQIISSLTPSNINIGK